MGQPLFSPLIEDMELNTAYWQKVDNFRILKWCLVYFYIKNWANWVDFSVKGVFRPTIEYWALKALIFKSKKCSVPIYNRNQLSLNLQLTVVQNLWQIWSKIDIFQTRLKSDHSCRVLGFFSNHKKLCTEANFNATVNYYTILES